MKWVILNSVGQICRAPYNTQEGAIAALARSYLPLPSCTIKCVSDEEAKRLMDEHFESRLVLSNRQGV